jgi:hypothetical protein
MADDDGGFLSRWSRRKVQVRRGEAAPEAPAVPAPEPPRAPATAAHLPAAAPAPPAGPPAPTLDDVARLTRDSDYTRFVARGVDTDVKNAALKKLFSDPHFNVMDGLDTYIDDYGKPDPLPLAMLRQMTQARVLGLFSEDDDEKKQTTEAGAALALNPEPLPAPPPDENPDLRLQPHDVAGRAGPEPGAGEDAGRPS